MQTTSDTSVKMRLKMRIDRLAARLARIDLLIARPVNKARVVRLKEERKDRTAETEFLARKLKAA